MAAGTAKNLENVLRDKPALVAAIVDNDLDRFLTPVAGETKIKLVRGNCHKACFLVQAYTTESRSQTNKTGVSNGRRNHAYGISIAGTSERNIQNTRSSDSISLQRDESFVNLVEIEHLGMCDNRNSRGFYQKLLSVRSRIVGNGSDAALAVD